ncbi:hypothetical protein [Flexivirga oryzae]|uniref:Uncharacterized protein n=1 Tax=Flexivirga oryzae TaxID=1794944 RepID=A0A839N500_9MICO|nr:hypothetical protein [Flexivirga oryzae]MBB2891144.1 hypothetical protein [Flexivirga oryzae]
MSERAPFDYVDRFDIRIYAGPMPDQPPTEVYTYVSSSSPSGLDVAVWTDDALMAALAPVIRPDRAGGAEAPYALDIHKSRFSWGASGQTVQAMLYVSGAAVTGIVGGAAWDGAKAVWHNLRTAAGVGGAIAPSREDAESLARAELTAAYSAVTAAFTLRSDSVETDSHNWRFEYDGDDGSTYVATVMPGPAVAITRTVDPDVADAPETERCRARRGP